VLSGMKAWTLAAAPPFPEGFPTETKEG